MTPKAWALLAIAMIVFAWATSPVRADAELALALLPVAGQAACPVGMPVR